MKAALLFCLVCLTGCPKDGTPAGSGGDPAKVPETAPTAVLVIAGAAAAAALHSRKARR